MKCNNSIFSNLFALILGFITCLPVVLSCNKSEPGKIMDAFINLSFMECAKKAGGESQIIESDTVSDKLVLLYGFNGDCTGCILEFVKWLRFWGDKNIFSNCYAFFIINSHEADLNLASKLIIIFPV